MASPGRTCSTWRTSSEISVTRLRHRGQRSHLTFVQVVDEVPTETFLLSVFSCGDQPIDYLTMSLESQPVRRLSTVSSVTKPPHYILTTQWLWYYKGDQGNWVEYGQPVSQTAGRSLRINGLKV